MERNREREKERKRERRNGKMAKGEDLKGEGGSSFCS